MVGLSASELPYEELHAGDTVEYFSFAFVSGDPRGHHVTVVLDVDLTMPEFPLKVATGEVIAIEMMLRRKFDSTGNALEGSLWRKLRTFTMRNGSVPGRTDREILSERFSTVVADVMSEHKPAAMANHRNATQGLTTVAQPSGAQASRGGHLRDDGQLVDEHRLENHAIDGRAQSIHRGMTFASGKDAVSSVKDFALVQEKSMRVARRSGMDRKLVCTSERCTYTVQVYRKRRCDGNFGDWYISSIRGEHINCTSEPAPTKHQIARNPTFQSAVNSDPKISASRLISMVGQRDGLALESHRRNVYRARDVVNEWSADASAESYQRIESFLSHFERLNPGSIAVMERNASNRFRRAMVAVKVVMDSIHFNQRVIGIDCTYSKFPWYDGVQMTLVGQDGNPETAILAFALVPSEDLVSYEWFFRQLLDGGYRFDNLVMFCDRDKAMLSVANTLGLNIRVCALHIIRNVTSRFRNFTQDHHNMIWCLQAADTEEAYQSQLACIKLALGTEVRTYLEEIPL